MSLVQRVADAAGLVVLAPPSRRETWDVLLGDFGPVVEFIDTALATAFDRCAVDPERVAIGGFSDGARYREFDGPHTVPGDISREAVDWLTSTPS